jgi:hypothetical protein
MTTLCPAVAEPKRGGRTTIIERSGTKLRGVGKNVPLHDHADSQNFARVEENVGGAEADPAGRIHVISQLN